MATKKQEQGNYAETIATFVDKWLQQESEECAAFRICRGLGRHLGGAQQRE